MLSRFSAFTLLPRKVKRCWRVALSVGLGLLFLSSRTVHAQPPAPHLVKDINTSTANAKPDHFTSVGSWLYFVADDGLHGQELWKTDGSTNGTLLVKDINPGSPGSEPDALFDFNGTLFFSAKDNNGDRELWKSDGTAAGTVRVKDINTAGSSSPQEFVVLGNTLYFAADDGVHGNLLWRSDGTEANTSLVKDLYPGNLSTSITRLTVVNGAILFAVYEPTGSVYGFWRSDGTANGTTLLKNINLSDANNLFEEHTVLNNTLYFATQDNLDNVYLWKSDGTPVGTVMVSQITPPKGVYDQVESFTSIGNTLYFIAKGGSTCGLWKSNGTAAGTALVTTACVGGPLVAANNTLYFSGADATTGAELWKSDGTTAGSGVVKDIVAGPDGAYPAIATNVGGVLYFFDNLQTGGGLWRSDGTAAGTTLVKPLNQGGIFLSLNNFVPFAAYNWHGTLYLSAEDGQSLADNDGLTGYEPWKSDGTTAGTTLVKDINTITNSSYPEQLTVVDHSLYFLARDPINAQELWKSNGTAVGTTLLSDINPDGIGTRILEVVGGQHLVYLRVYHDPASSLWRSDGTAAGTLRLKQLADNDMTSIQAMITAGDTLYFVVYEGGVGMTLWKSDGTAIGTVPIKTFPATDQPSIEFVGTHQGILYFNLIQKMNGQIQYQLWRSDGTADGTTLLKDGAAGWMIANGATLYFSSANPAGLWKSDGTAAGTVFVNPVGLDNYDKPIILNGVLYFRGYDGHGWELWKSDGTDVGTTMVKDIKPGTDSSDPGYTSRFVVMNNQLYFGAKDGDPNRGAHLWKSDGTEAGTVLVKAIFSLGAGPYDLTVANNHLYFLDEQDNGDKELWGSDGTAATTQPIMDLNDSIPGLPYGYRVRLVGDNDRIFFVANDATNTGFELWTLGASSIVLGANDLYTTTTDSVLTIAAPGVLGNDQDEQNGPLTAQLQNGVQHGKVSLHADGSFVYTPTAGFSGADTFTYNVTNSSGISATAVVSLTVMPPNQPPSVTNDTVTAIGPITIDVLANDSSPAGGSLTLISLTQPAHGVATIVSNKIVYTPADNFSGADSFTYTISDGKGGSATATVNLTVQNSPVNSRVLLPVVRR